MHLPYAAVSGVFPMPTLYPPWCAVRELDVTYAFEKRWENIEQAKRSVLAVVQYTPRCSLSSG